MNSTCCDAKIIDDFEVWRCSKCKASLIYNSFRVDGSLESQINEIKNNGEWIRTEFRFPDEDGKYEISNSSLNVEGIAEYDGYGFVYNGVYIEPNYWRTAKARVKRYGLRGE